MVFNINQDILGEVFKSFVELNTCYKRIFKIILFIYKLILIDRSFWGLIECIHFFVGSIM